MMNGSGVEEVLRCTSGRESLGEKRPPKGVEVGFKLALKSFECEKVDPVERGAILG